MQILTGWQNVYVIVGSAASALVGLQFVVLTLMINLGTLQPRLISSEAIHAFATPALTRLGSALVLSVVMCAPWPTLAPLSYTLAACGLAGLLYTGVAFRRAHRQTDYTPDQGDWFWYVGLPAVLYSALLVTALALCSAPQLSLFALAADALALLLLGIHNAWDSITFIATGHPGFAPAGEPIKKDALEGVSCHESELPISARTTAP